MQKLFYASGFAFLGDEVCDAVMEYAQALADVGKSDLVTVPALSDEGLRGESRLLIGPASQLFTVPALDRGVELDDPVAVRSMREKAARLRPARAHFTDEPAVPTGDELV
ncbi:MAG: hypothetical protein Q7T71_03545 [Herbiconiux sp.]|nr:hypothetical protein [Herbiconiux sp.]